MRIIQLVLCLLLAAPRVTAQVNDTIVVTRQINESFELKAPQRFYLNYTWSFPDRADIEARNVQVAFTTFDTFLINCRAADSCEEIYSDRIFKVIITEDTSFSANIGFISLYPNPVSSAGPYLTISCLSRSMNGEVKLFKNNGSFIAKRSITLMMGNNTFDFAREFASEQPGTYVLQFYVPGYTKSFMFLKQ